ncbi:MAG TPA: metallophosphoesterase [Euzebya sp.]|nr:metallophosphoesterase [Euzebya sp.]
MAKRLTAPAAMSTVKAVAGGVSLGAAAALAYAVGVERRWYARREVRLPLLRGPGHLRVLFFSDLHQARGQAHRLDFVRRVARECAPDLIVSGGDNLEHPDAITPVVTLHRDILDMTGAAGVAVLGAHDRYGPRLANPAGYLTGPSRGPLGQPLDTASLVRGMTQGGWTVLENAATTVMTAAGSVQVVGLDDPHIDRDDLSMVPRGDEEAVLRLGLVHAPYLRALHAFDDAGFDLALAGHTHGGQLAVPGWGALVSNCDLPPAQAKGTSWVGADLRLHVSAGLGHSIFFPMRFACRPELSVIDVVPRPS